MVASGVTVLGLLKITLLGCGLTGLAKALWEGKDENEKAEEKQKAAATAVAKRK